MIAEMMEIETETKTEILAEENYWRAVLNRDSRADGEFVYAVRSTGIYCRPSCSSRRPRQNQVSFFVAPEQAEQAGFRACQRCQPKAAKPEIELVQRACRYIEASFENAPTLTELSQIVNLSPPHFQRLFKRVMGISPRQYAEACRLGQLKARLREGEAVTNALYEVGYGSSSRLYERAPVQLGMTPAVYRKGGQGQTISYIITDCPLGRLLVAATERGICAVSLGDNDAGLVVMLRQEYPAAQIEQSDAPLGEWVEALLRYLNQEQPDLDLPLDVQATAFQWRVWQELRRIPYGSTRSYHEIAEAIGEPKATRAVARACATNKVALVIPCHRVIREDGNLGGYRWGLERKRTLLSQERTEAQPEL